MRLGDSEAALLSTFPACLDAFQVHHWTIGRASALRHLRRHFPAKGSEGPPTTEGRTNPHRHFFSTMKIEVPDRRLTGWPIRKPSARGSRNGPRKGPERPLKRAIVENSTAAPVGKCPLSANRRPLRCVVGLTRRFVFGKGRRVASRNRLVELYKLPPIDVFRSTELALWRSDVTRCDDSRNRLAEESPRPSLSDGCQSYGTLAAPAGGGREAKTLVFHGAASVKTLGALQPRPKTDAARPGGSRRERSPASHRR
ncbi:hypothetical protein THAOC_09278, partial [Thalassiosira oceanica]